MKRTLAITLAALMLAASLGGCAAAPAAAKKGLAGLPKNTEISPRITLTSSDAADAAAWLTARLGDKLTDRVVVGTSADKYGVSVAALEADGYFIRSLGGEVALFARSADGLDRAVRKYAKAVESGAAVGDVTYHEGYRVKRVELAGRDISEYTICCEDETNMLKAAKDLSALFARACGVTPAVSTAEPAAPYIALRYVHEDALGNVGHRWSVTEDGAVIECSDAYKPQSASLVIRRFLEKNLDWMGLIFGFEDLTAADLVTIPVGTSHEEKVAFDWASSCSTQTVKYEKLEHLSGGYGIRMVSDHGIQSNKFAGDLSNSPYHDWAADQPCWLDEDFCETARDDIVAYIERRLASGAVIGEDFVFVDVAQGDNSNWCKCRKCTKLCVVEGGTHAAEVLTWINALSDELDELYPGLYYGVFAYEMTKKPPKSIKPNEHVFISFCYDRSCSSHPLDGTKCTTCDQWGLSNPELTGYLDRWLEISENVSVWYYGIGNSLLSMSYLHTVRDDVRFLYDRGVRCLYWEAHEMGFMPSNWIAYCLHSELFWDVDMSDGDYDAMYERLLRLFFGDAANDMREYLEMLGRAEEYGSCYFCWGALADPPSFVAVDRDTFAAKYDGLFEILERAAALADSSIQETRMLMTGCNLIYTGSLCAYPIAKAAGDTGRMDELCRRYDLINERLTRCGMDMTNGSTMTSLWPANYKLTLKEIFPD